MVIDLTVAARFVRRRRLARNVQQPRRPDAVSSDGFAWLAAATGVHLSVCGRGRLQQVSVEGELDSASIDVIEHVLVQIFGLLPARVDFDLSRVSFIDRSAEDMIARARAQARTQNVHLQVVRSRAPLVWHPASAWDSGQCSRRR